MIFDLYQSEQLLTLLQAAATYHFMEMFIEVRLQEVPHLTENADHMCHSGFLHLWKRDFNHTGSQTLQVLHSCVQDR